MVDIGKEYSIWNIIDSGNSFTCLVYKFESTLFPIGRLTWGVRFIGDWKQTCNYAFSQVYGNFQQVVVIGGQTFWYITKFIVPVKRHSIDWSREPFRVKTPASRCMWRWSFTWSLAQSKHWVFEARVALARLVTGFRMCKDLQNKACWTNSKRFG